MRSLVGMIIMFVHFWRRKVTLYQKGFIIAIGQVSFAGDQWVVLRNVQVILEGERQTLSRLAVSRNNIDLFRPYVEGDDNRLQPLGIRPEQPVTAVASRQPDGNGNGDG